MSVVPKQYLENDAVISECGRYRYLLRRTWDYSGPRALLIMLNPSTADARQDDATIRSCVRLLAGLEYGSMEVVNVFAYRATNPDELAKQPDPIGPQNLECIEAAIGRCAVAICAWGAYPPARQHAAELLNVIRSRWPAVYCFGRTKGGAPKHPLYIKSGTPLKVFAPENN